MTEVKFIRLSFPIEKETEKAYYVQTKSGNCSNVERYAWIPKSACKVQEYVATYNALDEPETYGKTVVEVAEWWVIKNKLI